MVLDLLATEMNINAYVGSTAWMDDNRNQGWITKPMLRGIVPRQEEGAKLLLSPEEWSKLSGYFNTEPALVVVRPRPFTC